MLTHCEARAATLKSEVRRRDSQRRKLFHQESECIIALGTVTLCWKKPHVPPICSVVDIWRSLFSFSIDEHMGLSRSFTSGNDPIAAQCAHVDHDLLPYPRET